MKPNQYKITIIGSGNLGHHLAIHLHRAGYIITQVFSQHISNAESTAQLVGAGATDSLNNLNSDTDICFICVKDDLIEVVASAIQMQGKIIAHTSASVSSQVLQQSSSDYGVFYPLQTFSKNRPVDFSSIPVFIEGSNERTKQILLEVAKTLSKEVHQADGRKRLALHVAAVFANNFSNHLFAVAEKIVQKEGIPFRLLLPLINETIGKIQQYSPAEMQTGPAIRNDKTTIQKHLDYLAEEKNLQQLYELLSKDISQFRK